MCLGTCLQLPISGAWLNTCYPRYQQETCNQKRRLPNLTFRVPILRISVRYDSSSFCYAVPRPLHITRACTTGQSAMFQ